MRAIRSQGRVTADQRAKLHGKQLARRPEHGRGITPAHDAAVSSQLVDATLPMPLLQCRNGRRQSGLRGVGARVAAAQEPSGRGEQQSIPNALPHCAFSQNARRRQAAS